MKLNKFLLWLCIGFIFAYCGRLNGEPRVDAGLIDLSAASRQGKFSTELDGQWEFYPDKIASNGNFTSFIPSDQRRFIQVPALWRDSPICTPPHCAYGVGTYRLTILPPGDVPVLSILLKDVRSAHRLWINRELVSAEGSMGPDQQRSPHVFVATARIKNDGSPIELLLEVSNYALPMGGVGSSVLLGDEESIVSLQVSRRYSALLAVGFLAACAWFNFCFFLYHRGTRISFYLGLFIIFCVGNFVACGASDWVIQPAYPGLSLDSLFRITFVCFCLVVPSCFSFLQATFPYEFKHRPHALIWAIFGLIAIVSLIVPVKDFLQALPLVYLCTAFISAYSYLRLLDARKHQREGANIILAGFTVLLVIAANDMLYDLRIIKTQYLQIIGFVVFVATQEFLVIMKMSRSVTTVKTMTRRLKQKNMTLVSQIRERQRLESEIIKISEEERRNVSHDLHDGICQDLVAAQLYCGMLKDSATKIFANKQDLLPEPEGDCSAEEQSLHKQLRRLSELLEGAVNRAYDMSRGLWPIDVDKSGRASFLEEFCRRTSDLHKIDIRLSNLARCAICANSHLPQLYRIAQEAINNAVRHAKSDLIKVDLNCADNFPSLKLTIEDNGVGRMHSDSSSGGGLGMKIMAYRSQLIGGIFSVEDVRPSGTKICCIVECDCHTKGQQKCLSKE
ncbi:YndJ family transporter [uncultured Propionivibrio sp.]|uniref:sensor histidine kinase n=1 Tax=uncultured Propionivibrio sp. TaxID=426737 RepID=UPI0029C09D60|nr:7TM diverse intracellular signaling domain-containing protein [uncultured Propionivibrio sp.]